MSRRGPTVSLTPFVAGETSLIGADARAIPVELVEPRLGAGAFGEVYLARIELPGQAKRWVAVKVLKNGDDPEDQPAQRMRFEAEVLAQLNHQNVPTTYGLYTLNGRYALVTEYIEGEDLTACIYDEPAIGPSTMLEVVRDVASALESAFQLGIVHRDVKPSNIRLGRQGFVKLLDFGVARPVLLDERSAHTQTDTIVGTRLYLSPERLMHPNDTPDPSSDVFALGCVLFEGVTRHQFLAGLSFSSQAEMSLDGRKWEHWLQEHLTFLEHVEHVPDGTKELIRNMLAYRPASRPSAADVILRCDEIIQRFSAKHIGLKRWSREREWPPSPVPGEWSANEDQTSLERRSSPARRWSPANDAASLVEDPSGERAEGGGARSRSPSRSSMPALAGVALVVLGVLGAWLMARAVANPERPWARSGTEPPQAHALPPEATSPPPVVEQPPAPAASGTARVPSPPPPPAAPPGPRAGRPESRPPPPSAGEIDNTDAVVAEGSNELPKPSPRPLAQESLVTYRVQFNSKPLGKRLIVEGGGQKFSVNTPGHLDLPSGDYRVVVDGMEQTPEQPLHIDGAVRVFWDVSQVPVTTSVVVRPIGGS